MLICENFSEVIKMKKVVENAVLTATKTAYPVAVLTTKAAFLEGAELVEKIVADCKKAVADYFRYVPAEINDVEFNITDAFYYRLAGDYVENKKSLREFMRRSPAWNEDLQAWVINGNRTHEPDKDLIHKLLIELLQPALQTEDYIKAESISQANLRRRQICGRKKAKFSLRFVRLSVFGRTAANFKINSRLFAMSSTQKRLISS